MSFFLSDSLVGVIDESTLEDELENLGEVEISGSKYALDSFLSDGKSMRLQAVGKSTDAVRICRDCIGSESSVSIGGGSLAFKGIVRQAGWDNTAADGRLIIVVSVRDK